MKSNPTTHFTWRRGLLLAVLVLATYVLLPQIGQFSSSIEIIKKADVGLLALAFTSILIAGLTAALSYSQLSFRPIPFYRIALIQYAGMFINRLLPAGLGGVSLFIDFLYRHGHTLARASTVAALNNTLGLAAHTSLLLVAGVVTGFSTLPAFHGETMVWYGLGLVVFLLVATSAFHYVKQLAPVMRFLRSILRTLKQFRSRKQALFRAYICNIGTTILHIAALTFVMRAFGVDLSVVTSLVVLTGGVAAATVTPTPGGVVGAEAALTAVLITYGVNGSTALAIALSYRLVSYWLPILPGVAAFLVAQKCRYI